MVEGQKIIAFCGLDCTECEAYKATQENDLMKLASITERWSAQDEIDYAPKDMFCDGCHADRLNIYCRSCDVRGCGLEKGHKSCAKCDEYVCEKLRQEWNSWGEADWTVAKANLDRIKS